jgi:hypothetical protein
VTRPLLAGTIAAGAMIAQHVVGKATRDALFLSHFAIARLPIVMAASSVLSASVVMVLVRTIARLGPARVAGPLFAVHAALLVFEWALALRFEQVASVVVYLHTAALGSAVLSAFWSVVGERFDPHTAKKMIGRIGWGASLGGVVGGALAWGASKVTTVPTMLLFMAALNTACAWGVRVLASSTPATHAPPHGKTPPLSGLTALRDTPYLRLLALLVVSGALLQALLDYTVGAQAVSAYGKGPRLLSFFAVFQTAIGFLSLVLQSTANRQALERLGVGGTIALLPGAVAGLGVFAVAAPSLLTASFQRAAEGAFRGSLFRSAYEILFIPVPPLLKRATKTVIDVSFDRLGLLLGSGLALALARLWPSANARAVTVAGVVVAGAELALAYLLHEGYVATLAERLRAGSVKLDATDIVDKTTRSTLSRTLSDLDRKTLLQQIEAARAGRAGAEAQGESASAPVAPNASPDDVVRTLAQLRSQDTPTIRAALRGDAAHNRLLAHQVLELLGDDDVARDAMRVLETLAPAIVGTVVDVLLDEGRPPRTRRRAARLLAHAASQRAVDGLTLGLDAGALDVRHACGRELVRLRAQSASLSIDASTMTSRAKRELDLLSTDTLSLEHVFDIVALTIPSEAIQLAYGALQSPDAYLQGVALEYLDVVLPAALRASMMPRLSAASRRPAQRRPSARLLDDLLKSKEAIELHLDELRRLRDPDEASPRDGDRSFARLTDTTR